MYIFLPAALIFGAVFFGVFALYGVVLGRRNRVAGRIRDLDKTVLTGKEEAAAAETGSERLEGSTGQKPSVRFPVLERYFQKLGKKLEKAHLLYRPQEFFLLSSGMAVVVVFIAFLLLGGKFPGITRDPARLILLVLVSAGIGFMLPNIYLSFRISKLKHLLSSQVGDMLMLLSNYLRAGHAFARSMELVSREVRSPLADELKKFVRDISLGGGVMEALSDMDKRTEDEDLGLVIVAIQIQHQVGGNLAEIMDSINNTIRERVRLKGEIRTLTAQGRMTAYIICLLPVIMGLIIFYLYPDFSSVLFTDQRGQLMILIAVAAEVLGILLIRKIVEIKV